MWLSVSRCDCCSTAVYFTEIKAAGGSDDEDEPESPKKKGKKKKDAAPSWQNGKKNARCGSSSSGHALAR